MNGMVGIPTSPITHSCLDTPEQDIAEDVSSYSTVALDTPEQEQYVTEEVASVAGDASNVDRNGAAIYHNDAGIVHIIKC